MSRQILPKLERIPREIAALTDYEAFARDRLDDNAWAYLAGAAGDGLTAKANRTAFDALPLWPRVLRGSVGATTRIDLLGLDLAHPVLLAPVAYQLLFHPDGEAATAMAAAAIEALMIAPTLSSLPLEAIAAQAEGMPQWFQLYLQPDRGVSLALLRRAEAAGFRAIVLTVDAPINGIRHDERRAGFALPPGIVAANLVGFEPSPAREGHPIFDVAMAHAPGWDDLAWLVAETRLPVVVKGILHPEDAREAVARGVSAIIVSNHGGRTLDTLPAAITALPRIADTLGDAVPLLLDGGVTRGTDVLKALALGARAVLIGKAYAMALAAAGPLGVFHAVKLMVDELGAAMALAGIRSPGEAGRGLISG
jgi:4-hydroxymandelate oxidase